MSNHSRRNFIKLSAKSSLLLLLFQPFQKLLASPKISAITYPDWRALIEYARWCPTVHNLQPHKIKVISESEAELYYDASRLLPHGDPKCIFTTVAIGIFIENLSIAAAKSGFKVTMSEIGDSISTKAAGNTLFCKLSLEQSETKEEIDRELILKRRTSRLHYDGNPLLQEVLDKMKTEADKFDQEFFHSSEEETTDFVIDLNQITLFEDLGNEPVRNELDRLFRYNKEEAEEHKDGLWAKCMCFSGKLMKSVFKNHEKWEKGTRKKMLASHYKKSFKGTKTICWFGGEFENTNDWLNAGKMLARNWLILTGEGAYLQPFGSLITNEAAYEKINNKLTKPSGTKKIWLLFRAGYSDEPARSFRLNTDEIIIS